MGYDQFPPSPSLSTSSLGRSMEGMPLPPTIPVPLPPSGSTTLSSSITSPLLSSSMIPPGPGSDGHSAQSPMLNGSTDTIPTLAPTEPSLMEAHSSSSLPPSEPSSDPSLTLFLQVGKSVKKTRFEGDMTHSSLRMLFMEKFQYNPGQDDFPTIYVKDPQTNIHYELESMADVKQNAFLSLNVDEMENIQRKMDQGFASLSKELHEIKKAQEATEQARQKAVTVSTPSERSPNPESSQMLRSMVQKVLAKNKPAVLSPEIGASQGRFSVADLKPKVEEVQSLRRDLSVVRQLYTELQTETKTMLGSLAGYTSQIRKQALEAPVSSRLFIESGKVKLDKKSEDLTNKIEDLQDVVEDMKLNVTQRRGRPSDTSMIFVDKQCEEIAQEISELSDYIQTLRPSWKKTWEVELQTIVKEQMFLKEQEALLEDLKEDRGSLLQTLGNLRKLLELQLKSNANGLGVSREFHFQPAPVDEGFEGLKTVMEEVKLIAPDSDKRLRAMAQMEKLRHIELSNRIDEFEEELTNFVGESKLRKTGGAQEVERQRQQRDLENLKAMFGKKEGADAE
ncbi:Bud site selection protein 6 [Podila clonocystis]|nr:Bud site selection protein 6 [Podila clonocystis]